MNLTEAYLLLFVLLAVVAVVSIFFKSRMTWVTPSVFVVCAIVTLLAGMGVRYREIVEGPFVFLDSLMWVLCGGMFSYLLYENGTFQYIFRKISNKKRSPVMQLLLLTLFIALPGMLTGTAAASVATTGLVAGRYLLGKGVEKAKAVEVVAAGALFGVVLPPLCLPAMMTTVAYAHRGYPGSFEGYFLPCLIVALPALIVYCAMSGNRLIGEVEVEADNNEADGGNAQELAGSPVCLIPLIVVAVLVFSHNFLYFVIPFLGYPLIYTIGFILAIFLKPSKANPLESAAGGVRAVAPELALICAFGAAMETLTLVGTNGTVSAHMAILGVSPVLQVLVLAVLILLSGILLGPCFAFVLTAFSNYIVTEALYRDLGMTLLSMGIILSVVLFSAFRGGIVDMVGGTLEVAGVDGKSVLKRTWVPVALMLVVALIYMLARAACTVLMI